MCDVVWNDLVTVLQQLETSSTKTTCQQFANTLATTSLHVLVFTRVVCGIIAT